MRKLLLLAVLIAACEQPESNPPTPRIDLVVVNQCDTAVQWSLNVSYKTPWDSIATQRIPFLLGPQGRYFFERTGGYVDEPTRIYGSAFVERLEEVAYDWDLAPVLRECPEQEPGCEREYEHAQIEVVARCPDGALSVEASRL